MHSRLCNPAAYLPGNQNAYMAFAVLCFSLTQFDLDFECSLPTVLSLVQSGITWYGDGGYLSKKLLPVWRLT